MPLWREQDSQSVSFDGWLTITLNELPAPPGVALHMADGLRDKLALDGKSPVDLDRPGGLVDRQNGYSFCHKTG